METATQFTYISLTNPSRFGQHSAEGIIRVLRADPVLCQSSNIEHIEKNILPKMKLGQYFYVGNIVVHAVSAGFSI